MMVNDHVDQLASEVTKIIDADDTEKKTTTDVASLLRNMLANGLRIPTAYTQPNPERYVMYPLYVDPQKRFSIAAAVWGIGQDTPVHGHETWGVVGIYSGQEHEVQYDKPKVPNVPITRAGEKTWDPGEVTICCTTDEDVHAVSCAGNEPCVGIHIYGADIGTLERRSYNPETGAVNWFVSEWATPTKAR